MGNTPRLARLCRMLQQDRRLRGIAAVARQQGVRVYLVGGVVRDALCHGTPRRFRDWDFAVKGDAIGYARQIAHAWGATLVLLDESHGIARVILSLRHQRWQFDFAALRAATLKEDLRRRDFSINALAMDISSVGQRNTPPPTLIDYWRGCADIRDKYIRVIRPRNFVDDPLRVVRGFSLCRRLGFRFHPHTATLLPNAARGLPRVAPERLTEEFAILLRGGSAFPAVRDMAAAGILARLFPELSGLRGLDQGAYHHLDAWQHSIETLRQAELLRRNIDRYVGPRAGAAVRRRLAADIIPGRTYGWILMLACLLHDAGKPATRSQDSTGKVHFYTHDVQGAHIARRIGRRLALSGRETSLLARLIRHHLRPGQLVNRVPSKRAVVRFMRQMGEDSIALILLTIADRRAMRGRLSRTLVFHETVLWRIMRAQIRRSKIPHPRLLNGHDIIRLTGIPPGRRIGHILETLEEAQALGQVRTPAEAAAWVCRRFGPQAVCRA